MFGKVDIPGVMQVCEDGINAALKPFGTCSNLVPVRSGRKMLADGSMLITFNVRSSNPDITNILDTVLTKGAVSEYMAEKDFPGYTFSASSSVVGTQGSTNTAVTSSSTSSSSNTSSSSGTIAGAVVGVFAALAIAAAGLMHYRYRNKDINIMQEQEDAIVREASLRFDFNDIHKNSESGLTSNRDL